MSSLDELFIRLYLDEDVHKDLANALRMRGYDVISVHEVNRQGYSDEEQLIYAASQDRTLFTFNARDYEILYAMWLQQSREHAGLIFSAQIAISEALHRLLSLLNETTAAEMRNQYRWL